MSAKKIVVIDASVAIKWLHEEEKTEKALTLLDDIMSGEVLAVTPDLIIYEVANALIKGIRKPLAEAHEAIDMLPEIPWQIIPSPQYFVKDAMQLAGERRSLSVYDAMYVALALRYDAVVVTDDRKLYKLIGSPLIELL